MNFLSKNWDRIAVFFLAAVWTVIGFTLAVNTIIQNTEMSSFSEISEIFIFVNLGIIITYYGLNAEIKIIKDWKKVKDLETNTILSKTALEIIEYLNNDNSVFIYGPNNYDKTRIAFAVGTYFSETNKNKKVLYRSGYDLCKEYVKSLKENDNNLLDKNYSDCGLLIVDKVESFKNKEKTQEFMFNTFNNFMNSGKKIVFFAENKPSLTGFSNKFNNLFKNTKIVEIL